MVRFGSQRFGRQRNNEHINGMAFPLHFNPDSGRGGVFHRLQVHFRDFSQKKILKKQDSLQSKKDVSPESVSETPLV